MTGRAGAVSAPADSEAGVEKHRHGAIGQTSAST